MAAESHRNGKLRNGTEPGEKRRPSVKSLLMAPLISGMASLLFLIVTSLCFQYVTYYDRLLAANRASSLKLYNAAVRDRHILMGSLLEVIASDTRLAPLFESRDADGLIALYDAAFERLRRDYRIASLVFIDPLSCVIADISRPENSNTIITRHIFAKAERMGSAAVGLDADESGGLTLRMARPVFNHNVLIGYIETAIDFSEMAGAMPGDRDEYMVFSLNKNATTEDYLHTSGTTETAQGLWVETSTGLLMYSPAKILGSDVILALQAERKNLSADKTDNFTLIVGRDYYAAGTFPLTDSLGAPLGDLLIVEKTTGLLQEYLATAALLLGLGAAIILACRWFVADALEKTDARLSSMMSKISESDAMFENVFAESETGFVLQNWISGKVLRANRVALSIFGVEEAAGINLSEMRQLTSDDITGAGWQATEADSPLMRVSTGKGVTYCELNQFFLGDNEEIQCLAIRDVTRVVALQKENREQLRYLQDVVDQIPCIILIKDPDCRLTMYNSLFDRTFGDGRNMVGKIRFADWLGKDMDLMLSKDLATLDSGKPSTFEESLTLRDGHEHTFLISQQVISGSNGGDLLCVATDITERVHLEKQLNSLRLKAEEANQAKSQFLARMSHEIRTPMNVILGMSHLGLAANPDEQQFNYLSKIHGAARNLLGIINDILDFSKVEAGEMNLERIPFSMDGLLLDLESEARTLAGDKPVEFQLALPGVSDRFMGDPLRIRQVLLNLVSNAIKFTDSGRVRLACRLLETLERAHVLEFSVADTGIGIPEEAMTRLFTSFQQVDGSTTRKYGGTGLGLAISQQLVQLMGGNIAVSSTPGQGSTFEFTLVLDKAKKESGETERIIEEEGQDELREESAETTAGTGALPGSANILVVEDNEINQEIILELLARDQWRITAVGDGREAVRAVTEQDFDLVFMDLQMPVMDGLDATMAIRALPEGRAAEVPIIALTANAMIEDRELCLKAGMNDFLSKPIEVPELEEKLRRWLV